MEFQIELDEDLASQQQVSLSDTGNIWANLDMLYQCKQFADGHGVVMDNFKVGGIDMISKYDKSHAFFNSQQNVDLMNFVAPSEASRTCDEYGYYEKKFSSMSKVVSYLSVQTTHLGCERSPASKGQWTAEEDWLLTQLVEQFGLRRWSYIAQKLPGRLGKQCRERWHNHLRPNIKRETWSEEEDKILIQAHAEMGNKWSEIAKKLPGRTQNAIKNHWNATKRRQYSQRKRRSKYPRASLLQEYIQSLNVSTSERFPQQYFGGDLATAVNNNANTNEPAPAVQPRLESDSCSSDDNLVRNIIELGELPDLLFDEKLLQEGCTLDSLLEDLPSPRDASVKDGGGEDFGMEMLDMDLLLECEEPNEDLDLVEMITQINA
ncbi:hypothetical protein BT93_B0063 [Corymbia citriodora subsp. variegata]|nr:hypothetical protein BT93_B0063 [Corymbia citriodora subsp. variegata]